MTISWVANGNRNSRQADTSITNGSVAAGIAAGDLLISICTVHNADTISMSNDQGFTPITTHNSGSNFETYITYKIATGSETSGPTFTWTNAANCFTIMYAYRSTVGFATPPVIKNSNTGGTSTHSVTGFNASHAGSWAVYMDQAKANTALATPAGWTEDRDAGNATNPDRDTAGHKALTNGGDASGNISVTGANATWLMQMLELTEQTATRRKRLSLLGVG